MNVITVTPLGRWKTTETLSYFTSSDVPVGALVSIPIRSKTHLAVVIESRTALDLKTEIRNAPYEIRKLSGIQATHFFPTPFIEACKKLAQYYCGTIGSVIDTLSADAVISNVHKIDAPDTPQGTALSRRLNLETTTYAIQGDDADRISSWRSLIREEFARKKSIVVYVPTIEDGENLATKLTKGIEGYIFTLYGSLSHKKILQTWKAIAENEHPIVVIATPSFSFLPRSDIDTVIIERENGRGWISPRTPYIDMRHALETIAHMSGQVVYRADIILRVETLQRLHTHTITQGSPSKWRSISLAHDTLVDMRLPPPRKLTNHTNSAHEKSNTSVDKPGFEIVSRELRILIENNHKQSTHLFIYTLRRGFAPTTVCGDCERIVTCPQCSSPTVLHTSKTHHQRFYLCHMCGERHGADISCTTCGGWRLTPLGIGIERVKEEIASRFPHVDLFVIDPDSTPTEKLIEHEMGQFRSQPGSILLGTETALVRLRDMVDHTAVVSLDSLYALPDFRMTEKIMYTLTRLRMLSTKSIMVQTRRPDERVFDYGLKGNLSDFYRGELEERKRFAYPPFQVLIKITIEGKKEPIARAMAEVKKLIEPHEVDIFPAFTSTTRGQSIIHGLVRIAPHMWPDPELVARLKALPPSVTVKVDPETLL